MTELKEAAAFFTNSIQNWEIVHLVHCHHPSAALRAQDRCFYLFIYLRLLPPTSPNSPVSWASVSPVPCLFPSPFQWMDVSELPQEAWLVFTGSLSPPCAGPANPLSVRSHKDNLWEHVVHVQALAAISPSSFRTLFLPPQTRWGKFQFCRLTCPLPNSHPPGWWQ